MYLPTVIADVLTAVIAGGLGEQDLTTITRKRCGLTNDTIVTKFGYYNPFLLFGLLLLAIGAGLDTTLVVNSDEGRWIGFQILCGVGFALLVQMVRSSQCFHTQVYLY